MYSLMIHVFINDHLQHEHYKSEESSKTLHVNQVRHYEGDLTSKQLIQISSVDKIGDSDANIEFRWHTVGIVRQKLVG